MGSLTFVLNGHPPRDNTMRRWGWRQRSREMRTWRDAAAWSAKAAYRESSLSGDPVPVRIHVKFMYRIVRTRDVANLVASTKPIIDGIVDARMLPDDSPKWLPGGVSVEEVVDPKGIDGIEVTITEIEP